MLIQLLSMAFRRATPALISDVLQRRHRGESRSQIAATTGISRKTAARYINLAVREGWAPREPPTQAIVESIERALRPGRKSATVAILRPIREEIRERLALGRPLTTVHAELRARGVEVSYSSLHRFVVSHI